MIKNLLVNAGDKRNVGFKKSPGGGHGNPLQYSYLENPMGRRGLGAIVHGVTKSSIHLKRLSTHACTINVY